MQLKSQGRIAAAAVAAIGMTNAHAQSTFATGWSFDSSTLLYAEGDGRVKVFEPKLEASRNYEDGQRLSATVTIDTLSGATPNGAAPAPQAQTFFLPHSTSSSSGGTTTTNGNSTYTTSAGTLPVESNYKNQRGAAQLTYGFLPRDKERADLTANLSIEDDYTSYGGGGHWSHDFNDGNTTLGGGLNVSFDTLKPIGGVFTPLSTMDSSTSSGPGSASKTIEDVVLGVTQLLSPTSLMQLNYSLSHSSGYLNDPYKIVSVVNPDASPDAYIYESRPRDRTKHALYGHYRGRALGSDIFDASYRFMIDNWGINSHTIETSYRAYFPNGTSYLEPSFRFYTQTQANFYRVALDKGEQSSVQYVSADQRLGRFSAITPGLEYGSRGEHHFWNLKLEYYKQSGSTTGLPAAAGAALSQFNVAPNLTAYWLIFGFSYW